MCNRAKTLFSSLLISVLFVSCWNKQSSRAEGPELPNYTVSGTVFNSVTYEPLLGATVTIDDQRDTTDSLGQYSISHVLGGESHSITATKGDFETYASSFLLGYADLDSFDIVLGMELYFADRRQSPFRTPNGLIWTGDIPWASDESEKRICVLEAGADGFSLVKYFDSPGSTAQKGYFTTPYGLTVTEEGGTHYVWISVAYDASPPRIYKMAVRPDTILATEAHYDTPESNKLPGKHVLLDDLTFDGTHIWSCSSNEERIYKHGSDMSVLQNFNFQNVAPTGIAWDGEDFWLTSLDSNRLYKLDGTVFALTEYYVLPEAPVAGLLYRDGFLWACKHGSLSSWFYMYSVE